VNWEIACRIPRPPSRDGQSRHCLGQNADKHSSAASCNSFATSRRNCWFSGILGDRFGRRFSYQLNLAIFGLASIAAAFAPNIQALIVARFVIVIGLGAVITNFSLFVSSMVGLWGIPNLGWRLRSPRSAF
jgi:MFS family permease